MEEKLEELINQAEERLFEHEENVRNLMNKNVFLRQHGFEEEARMSALKIQIAHEVVLSWRQSINNLKEMLNKWNS